MRSKKNVGKRTKKNSHKKSKKCGCGVKIPFLKWGGDSQNVPNNNSKTDLTGKLGDLLSASTKKLSADYNDLTTYSKKAIDNVTDSTKSVINDTGNQITNSGKDVADKAQDTTKKVADKTSGFFGNLFNSAKKSLYNITKPKDTNNDGSFPSKPMPPKSTSSTASTGSSTSSTSSTSSSKPKEKYVDNSISKYRKLSTNNNQNNNNNNNQQGGRKRSSKKAKAKREKKSKKSKRIRRTYKGGSASCTNNQPVGIENSSLAFTSAPINNIRTVEPSNDQTIGQNHNPPFVFHDEY